MGGLGRKKHLLWIKIGLGCFPGGPGSDEPACQGRSMGSIPGSGRSPGGGDPLQYSCLENPWTEEPGRLQSIWLHRVRHGWSDLAHTHTPMGVLIAPSTTALKVMFSSPVGRWGISAEAAKELNCMSLSSPLTHLVRSLQSHKHVLLHKSNWTGGTHLMANPPVPGKGGKGKAHSPPTAPKYTAHLLEKCLIAIFPKASKRQITTPWKEKHLFHLYTHTHTHTHTHIYIHTHLYTHTL